MTDAKQARLQRQQQNGDKKERAQIARLEEQLAAVRGDKH